MDLYPSIDIRGGRCVRLLQGDYDREIAYDDDPVSVARRYADAGASWVHVVDLDAARSGEAANRDVVAAVAGAVTVPVQAGGGVRDEAAADALFEAGVARVVVGTAAVEDPDFLRRLAGRRSVALGLDVRDRAVAVRGWREDAGEDVYDALVRFEDAGVEAVVVTQIIRDGLLQGPDLAGLTGVLRATALPIIASGGVGALDDLRALAALEADGRRLAGAIVGRALYEGAFTIEDALSVVT